MKRIVMMFAVLAIAAGFMGCNTVRGVGKDVERAGEGIQNATK